MQKLTKQKNEEKSKRKAHFAIVIEEGDQKSAHDVLRIALREELSPVLVALAAGEAYHTARGLALKLDAPIIMPRNLGDFRLAAGGCAFSICDGVNGAILSLLSYTPAYLDASSGPARELITIANMVSAERPVILPFNKRKPEKIRKVGVRDSDFIYTRKGLYEFIEHEFYGKDNSIIHYPPSGAFQSQ